MKEEKQYLFNYLKKNTLFKGLKDEYFYFLIENIEIQKHKAGKLILYEKEASDSFYLIKQGVVQVVQNYQFNRRNNIDLLNKNDFFGEMGIFNSSQLKNELYFYAYTQTIILKIKHEKLRFIFLSFPQIKEEIHTLIWKQMYILQKFLGNIVSHNLEQRVCDVLLYLNEKFGKKHSKNEDCYIIHLKVTHRLVSEFIGTTRESITKILSILKKKNIIFYARKTRIVIPSIQQLKSLSFYEKKTNNSTYS